MADGKVPVQINIRLWPGPDDDLIAWYKSIDVPRGRMAQVVRNTLRRGIRGEDDLAALQREVAELRAMVQMVVGKGGAG